MQGNPMFMHPNCIAPRPWGTAGNAPALPAGPLPGKPVTLQ